MIRPLALALLGTLAAGAGAQLLSRERAAVDDVLLVAGLRRDEIKLAPRAGEGPLAANLAGNPLEGIDGLLAFAAELSASPGGALDLLRKGGLGDAAGNPFNALPVTLPATVPPALRPPLTRLVGAVSGANVEIRAALAKLSPEEKRRLIEELPTWAGRRAGLRPEFSKAPQVGPGLFALLGRVDLPRLRRAGAALDVAIDAELPALRAAIPAVRGMRAQRFVAADVIVELGSTDDDLHASRDAGLVVDLGGQDRYTGRAGAGIGYAAALVDLGGGARFELPDAGAGCGLLGIGIARIEGEASGTSDLLAFGAGVAGVGLFTSGRANLESRGMAQGFGLAGLGVLRTGSGRDGLRLGGLGQGCGLAGGAGLVLDAGGGDRYECPGLAPDELASANESCAQGYGEGGLGLLVDGGGDDLYEIGARGQGAAQDGGLGLLYDVEGDDLRRAARFAQGYGASGSGLLIDLAGDDLNATQSGEAHGSAASGGLGVHLDRSGDDAVLGGAAGIAAEGGFALFLEGAGEDSLAVRTRPEEAGGVGIFLLLGAGARGFDLPALGAIRPGTEGTVAAAPGNGPVPPGLDPVAPGSLPPNPERIARAVGLLVSRRGALRAGAVRELIAYGRPGLDAAVERLDDLDAGGLDAMAEIVEALGELGRRAVAARLEAPGVNALKLAGRARIPVATPLLLAALEDPNRRDAALEAIGGAGDPAIAPAVLPLVVSEEPGVPRLAMRALLRVGGPAEEPSLRSLVTTPDRTLRLMVHAFIARFPGALAFGRDLSQDVDAARAAAGIAILGLVGGDEALRVAGTGLNSPTREVRLAALRALNGRVPEGWRSRVLELQGDSDPLVSAAARGVEFGR